jgi:hypothetical protein
MGSDFIYRCYADAADLGGRGSPAADVPSPIVDLKFFTSSADKHFEE